MHDSPLPQDHWIDSFAGGNGDLSDTLKRVKQELRGQIDAERLDQALEAEARDAADAEEIAWAIRLPYAGLEGLDTSSPIDVERPTAHFARDEQLRDRDERPQPAFGGPSELAPRSLPALLYTIAQLSGAAFESAISRVTGQQSTLGDLSTGDVVRRPRTVRARIVTAADASLWLCSVAVAQNSGESAHPEVEPADRLLTRWARGAVHFSRRPLDPDAAAAPMYATYSLPSNPAEAAVSVLAVAFKSDTEIVFAVTEEGAQYRTRLSTGLPTRTDFSRHTQGHRNGVRLSALRFRSTTLRGLNNLNK